MKLVLLFFCGILILIILGILLLIFSTVKINVKKFNLNNIENGVKKTKIEKELVAHIELFLFGRIKFAKINVNRRLLKKIKIKNDFKSLKKDIEIIKKINVIDLINKLKIKLDKINLEAQIGTDEIMITVFLVPILSSIIGIIVKDTDYEKVNFTVIPLYKYGNVINFKLNCIINVKMVHIIYVIYILLKKGMIKNERTSNRRSYDYSYE